MLRLYVGKWGRRERFYTCGRASPEKNGRSLSDLAGALPELVKCYGISEAADVTFGPAPLSWGSRIPSIAPATGAEITTLKRMFNKCFDAVNGHASYDRA